MARKSTREPAQYGPPAPDAGRVTYGASPDHVHATISTPLGDIAVAWNRRDPDRVVIYAADLHDMRVIALVDGWGSDTPIDLHPRNMRQNDYLRGGALDGTDWRNAIEPETFPNRG